MSSYKTHLSGDPDRSTIVDRIQQHEAEQQGPDPAEQERIEARKRFDAEYGYRAWTPEQEAAARDASAVVESAGGSVEDQREAASAVVDEVRKLREAVEGKPLPPLDEVDDETYFANRDHYAKQLGLKRRAL